MTSEPSRLILTAEELQELTGYRQHRRQLNWLIDRLKIKPVVRPDGFPVVLRTQVEAAFNGKPTATAGPQWSKIAA